MSLQPSSPCASPPRRAVGAVLALVAGALLGGCKSSADAGLYVPGATELCQSLSRDTFVQSCRFGFARQFGDDLLVSTVSATYGGSAISWSYPLFVSRDGVAWTAHSLADNATTSAFDPTPPAVFQLGDEFHALVRYPSDTPEGYTEYFTRLQDWTPAQQLVGGWWGPAVDLGAKVGTVMQERYAQAGGSTALVREWREFDPKVGEVRSGQLPVPETDPTARIDAWVPTLDANGTTRLVSLVLTADKFCRVEVVPSGFRTFVSDCVPRSALPEGVENWFAMRAGPYGPMLLLRTGTNAYAATVSPAQPVDPRATMREGVLRLADLGSTRVDAVLHIAHAAGPLSNLWPVGQSTSRGHVHVERFVRVASDMSLQEVDLPVSPCTDRAVDEGLCQEVTVQEITPLVDDRYLVVYNVSTHAPPKLGGVARLVALVVTVAPSTSAPNPDAGTEPPEPPAGEPFFGAELEACAHAVACGWHGFFTAPDNSADVARCAASLIAIRQGASNAGVWPAQDLGRFLECGRTATSCRSFALCMNGGHDEAYCAAHPGPSCDGSWAVTCPSAAAPATEGLECSGTGNQCWVMQGRAVCGVEHPCGTSGQCSGTSGYWRCGYGNDLITTGFVCPAGTSCQTVLPGGAPLCAGPPCTATQPCAGEVFRSCVTVGSVSYERRTDCASQHEICSPSGCVPATAEPCTGVTGTCVGDEYRACLANQHVSFDCKANGFTGCGLGAQGTATCVY